MVQFRWKRFEELTAKEIYEILKLRAEVFVVQQNCAYLDPDGKDFSAMHLLGYEDENLVTYIRLFPPTEIKNHIIFGRVVTAESARGKGYGKQLMQALLDHCNQHFPNVSIQCSSQAYLQKFYESFGFVTHGQTYLEDNIPHIAMIRSD